MRRHPDQSFCYGKYGFSGGCKGEEKRKGERGKKRNRDLTPSIRLRNTISIFMKENRKLFGSFPWKKPRFYRHLYLKDPYVLGFRE